MRFLVPSFVVFACVLAAPARADPQVAAVFGDHCVLQRDAPVAVWGTAEPGERITVRVAGRGASAETGADGRWRVELPALKAGGPHAMSVIGKRTLRVEDVLVGEVWLCSGQSNMQWPVGQSQDAKAEIAAADHPEVRLLTVPPQAAVEPLTDVKASWAPCAPDTVRSFSAVAYYFGREIHDALKVPVGLIDSSYGGTPAEAWTPIAALRAEPSLTGLVDGWEKRIAAAEAKGQKDAALHPHRPGNLYRAMIAPLAGLSLRGVIWYQGESNASRAWEYRTLFPTLIASWRAAWQRPDLPFGFVQLAAFGKRAAEPGDNAWAELRDAQLFTLRTVPHTGMAVTIDIGDAERIHPANKQDVGRRLARWALCDVYGRRVEPSGPLYRAMEIRGPKVVVSFDHVGKGLKAGEEGAVEGFTVAGADRAFVPAIARIEGEQVVVFSPAVTKPVAVRYAWAANPACDLANAEGLPASPFRTDEWPLTTQR